MKTKTYEVYKYDELPENVKAKVIDNYRDINVDHEWWDYDGKTGFSPKEIKKYHLEFDHADDLLTYKKLYFDCDRGWYIQFVDAEFKHDETARKFLGIPKRLWERIQLTINDTPGRGVNTRLEYELLDKNGFCMDGTTKQREILDRAVDRFSDKIEQALKDLRDSYEYLVSNEAVEEAILVNEYEFTLDGKIDDN